MKKILLASTVLAGLTATASAADLPRRAAPPPVFAPIPVFTWTGFYAGVNAGYGFGTGRENPNLTFVDLPAANGVLVSQATGAAAPGSIAFANSRNQEGFVGGGQIGYNWQLTPGAGIVFGIEADAQYVDFGRNRERVAGFSPGVGNRPGVTLVNPNGLSGLDFFGTVRGRLGYAFDRLLVFGTGGFAYGSGGNELRAGVSTNVDDFRTGWAAGGGIEYALPTDSFLNFFKSSAVTFKIEGLYVNLERNRNNGVFAVNTAGTAVGQIGVGGVGARGFVNRRDDEFAVVRAGLNYKFGSY